ncbi:hypothetical protein [Phenylobacterium sp.]|uniref:hypothetical protein n=1 Tax=Phenylobacterium sp. TaxID=1871053 RepID=UPI0035B04B1A
MGVVHLVFITRNPQLYSKIEERKSRVVPAELRRSGPSNRVEAGSFLLKVTDPIQDAEKHIVSLGKNAAGLIVVCDPELRNYLDKFRDVCFLNELPERAEQVPLWNYLQRVVALVIRNYEALRIRFGSVKNLKILLLPLKNFEAEEIKHLQSACSSSLKIPRFPATLDLQLDAIRRLREHPKRKSSSDGRYFVDDRRRHFAYGHEDHSRCETAAPHDYLCLLRRDFRFGLRIEHPHRHFNVSYDKRSIKGSDFKNCHGANEQAKRASHVNMFPGGYLS